MKTLLLTVTLVATQLTTTFASEVKYLTKAEYISLMKQNTTEYEEVTPGMTIEYSDNLRAYTNGVLTATCPQTGQATVMAKNLTHYLVYRKVIKDADCDSYKQGDTTEWLTWQKIRTFEQEESFIMDELSNHKITQLNETTVLITGIATASESTKKVPFKKIVRLGDSQFRTTDYLEEGDYRFTLFLASEVDTTQIEIAQLFYRNHY